MLRFGRGGEKGMADIGATDSSPSSQTPPKQLLPATRFSTMTSRLYLVGLINRYSSRYKYRQFVCDDRFDSKHRGVLAEVH